MLLRIRFHLTTIIFLFLSGLTACTGATTPPSIQDISIPSPTVTEIGTNTVAPSPLPSLTSTVTPIPLDLSDPQVVVLVDNLSNPDDLLLAPDGSIYISDVGDGTIKHLLGNGTLQVILSGLNEPEGMVFLPDGSLVIVEQNNNRLLRYDPNTKLLTPFLNLTNTTGKMGVDGISLDGQSILIPDSPNGTLLSAGLDGKGLVQIAAGFNRPTDVWPEADGSYLIVDENANSLSRLHPDGTLEKLASLPIPDDVIEDQTGDIFVNTLGDGSIRVFPHGTSQDIVLVNGLSSPQGLIFDTNGNLIVTDSGHHRLIRVVIR